MNNHEDDDAVVAQNAKTDGADESSSDPEVLAAVAASVPMTPPLTLDPHYTPPGAFRIDGRGRSAVRRNNSVSSDGDVDRTIIDDNDELHVLVPHATVVQPFEMEQHVATAGGTRPGAAAFAISELVHASLVTHASEDDERKTHVVISRKRAMLTFGIVGVVVIAVVAGLSVALNDTKGDVATPPPLPAPTPNGSAPEDDFGNTTATASVTPTDSPSTPPSVAPPPALLVVQPRAAFHPAAPIQTSSSPAVQPPGIRQPPPTRRTFSPAPNAPSPVVISSTNGPTPPSTNSPTAEST